MGYVQKRVGRDGKPRYTAVYQDLRSERRSAGTFANKKDANTAWQKAEAKVGEGRLNDPRRGRQTFRRYVTEEWLPHHVMEATTREAYTYQISKHILPWFGPMRMNEIMPSHVREWVTDLQAKEVSPASIQKVRFILSAIFTSALNDVTFLHPSRLSRFSGGARIGIPWPGGRGGQALDDPPDADPGDAAQWWEAYCLAENDEADELRRRPGRGDDHARRQLACWLAERGRAEEAAAVIRPLADAGEDIARLWRARWLADCGQASELRQRAGAGDDHALAELAEWLAAHHRFDELYELISAKVGRAGQLLAMLADAAGLPGCGARVRRLGRR